MAATTVTNNADAAGLLSSQAAASGVTSLDNLSDIGRLATIVANIINGGASLPLLTATSASIGTCSTTTVTGTTGTITNIRALSSLGLGAAAGGVQSISRIPKAISAMADATFVDVFTVTVPNAAHSAVIRVTAVGSLGAGGSIGANESTHAISYDISVARTAGLATVAVVSSAFGSATSTVAGGQNAVTLVGVSAMTGAASVQQTFTIQAKVTRAGAGAANHTCFATAEILNANATGVTIA